MGHLLLPLCGAAELQLLQLSHGRELQHKAVDTAALERIGTCCQFTGAAASCRQAGDAKGDYFQSCKLSIC